MNLPIIGDKVMIRNVGSPDRIIRVLLGIIGLAAGYYFNSWWGLVGIVPLFTAALGWCPLYLLFGISTCTVRQQQS